VILPPIRHICGNLQAYPLLILVRRLAKQDTSNTTTIILMAQRTEVMRYL